MERSQIDEWRWNVIHLARVRLAKDRRVRDYQRVFYKTRISIGKAVERWKEPEITKIF